MVRQQAVDAAVDRRLVYLLGEGQPVAECSSRCREGRGCEALEEARRTRRQAARTACRDQQVSAADWPWIPPVLTTMGPAAQRILTEVIKDTARRIIC